MTTVSIEHYFQIESVVNNVFKYLRLNEIIKQRTVCKLWHKIGTKILVDRIDEVQIKFGSNFSLDKPDPRKTVENFMRMQDDFSFKFTNFATYYYQNDLNGKVPKAEQTAQLFQVYGRYMKKISLYLSGKNCWRFLSDVLTTQAPNVEELHLNGNSEQRKAEKKLFPEKKPELKLKSIILYSDDAYNDPTYNREFLSDLFECSPHLECLVIALDMDDIHRYHDHEHRVLKTLAHKGHITNLKCLSLGGSKEDEFETLAKHYKRAPFKEFIADLEDIDSMETLSNIETFLKDHKDTWTKLKLSFPCVEEDMGVISFPEMINLTHLSIGDWCIEKEDVFECPFGSFDFGRQFPSLVTLNLRENPKTEGRRFFDLEEWFPEQATPLLSLKNLTLPPQFHSSILRRIGRIFPNVISLELTVQTPDVLKELWITWPEIKKLDIAIIPAISFGSTSLDSIFTGITDASSKTLLNCHTSPVAVKSFLFIGRLKRLTHLLIKGPSPLGLYKVEKSFSAGSKITNETARLALKNLKELVFLRISKDLNDFSPFCVRDLCNELGLRHEKDGDALRLVKYEWQKEIRVYDW